MATGGRTDERIFTLDELRAVPTDGRAVGAPSRRNLLLGKKEPEEQDPLVVGKVGEGRIPEGAIELTPTDTERVKQFEGLDVGIFDDKGKTSVEITGVKRRADESTEKFLAREKKFREVQQLKEERAKSARFAEKRAKREPGPVYQLADLLGAPSIGQQIEVATQATAQGAGGVIGSAFEGLSLIPGLGEDLQRRGMVVDPRVLPTLSVEEAGTWTAKFFEGLGSSIPFGLMAVLTGGAGTAALGAASGAGTTFADARSKGATESEAKAASVIGGLIGSLEGALGIGRGRFAKPGVVNGLIRFLKEAGEEGFQEATSQLLNNLNAKILSGYDPQKALDEGLAENFLIGAAVGGVFNAPGLVASTVAQPQFDVDAIRDQLIGRAAEVKAALPEPVAPEVPVKPPRVVAPISLASLAERAEARPGAAAVAPVDQASNDLIDRFLRENSLEGRARFEAGPAETGGFVMVPDELKEAVYLTLTGGSTVSGYDVSVNAPEVRQVEQVLANYFDSQVLGRDPRSENDLISAFSNAKLEAQAKGLSSIRFVVEDKAFTQDYINKIKSHESFHGGQKAVADFINKYPELVELQYENIHSDVIYESPAYQKASKTVVGNLLGKQVGQALQVAEFAAYFAAGQEAEFNIKPEEAVDYLTDYLLSVVDKSGAEGLDILSRRAQLTERLEQLIGGLEYEQRIEVGTALGTETPRREAATAPGTGTYSGGGEAIAGSAGSTGGRAAIRPPGEDSGDIGGGEGAGPDSRPGHEPIRLDDLMGAEVIPGETVFNDPLGPPTGGPPAPPRQDIGPLADDDPLLAVILNEPYRKAITKGFMNLLDEVGVERDPSVRVFVQVTRAIAEGKIDAEQLDRAIYRYGITLQDLSNAYSNTVSEAGRVLNEVSQIERYWSRMMEENKRLKELFGKAEGEEKAALGAKVEASEAKVAKVVPAEKLARAVLDDLQASRLGRDLWQRGGDILRKMALSDISITAYNILTTTARLPIEAMNAASTGVAMGLINPKKYGGKSWATVGEATKEAAFRELRPIAEVLTALTPVQLRRLIDKNARTAKQARADNALIMDELRIAYPDLEHKLRGLSSGLEKVGTVTQSLKTVEGVIAKINDAKKREAMMKEFRELARRSKFNDSLAGKVIRGIEWPYEQLMRPNMIQELAFRAPFFAGALRSEAEKLGFDVNNLIARKALDALPKEAVERAVDRALEFTYAYDPKRDGGKFEAAANYLITGINKMGPVGFVVEAFPRALYNGLKFMYEYSPVGAFVPAGNVARDLARGRFDDVGRPIKGREAVQESDVMRLSKALIGTAMLGTAFALREAAGGEEWWQIKTGMKDSKGNPIYFDIRKFMPMAGYMWAADFSTRIAEGRAIDKSFKEWGELYFGMRRSDVSLGGTFEAIDAAIDYWGGETERKTMIQGAQTSVGRFLALPATPLGMIRDLFGQFTEGEAERKELRGTGLWGPSLEKLPWLRRDLPAFESLTERDTLPTSEAPAGRLAGMRFEAPGFATREMSRLGINPGQWLPRDSDPTIDQMGRQLMGRVMERIGQRLETSAEYIKADDKRKAWMWETMLGVGEEGSILSDIKSAALDANPREKAIREEKAKSGMGRFGLKASGLNERLKQLKEKK